MCERAAAPPPYRMAARVFVEIGLGIGIHPRVQPAEVAAADGVVDDVGWKPGQGVVPVQNPAAFREQGPEYRIHGAQAAASRRGRQPRDH